MLNCYHCGNDVVENEVIVFNDKNFCCKGCQTVYDLFESNGLTDYYDFEQNPGAVPKDVASKYNYLDNTDIADKLIDFKEGTTTIVRLYIPHIHCSSCIWILENLHTLNPAITHSQVVFSQKKVSITFNSDNISLKNLVLLLASIGYEPYISLEQFDAQPKLIDRSLLYKIGVAFFGFGNIMLLSFPEYFNVDDLWMQQYRGFFRYINILLALPVFLYSATPYYKSAYHSIKTKAYNIDIPMALGIIVMFVRSLVDIFFQDGAGFLDSMCGLVFFMLSGKLIQQTTYNFLSFERDYKSYFPIAVTKIQNEKESPIQVYEIEKGNQLLIRNEELIPVDAILLSETAFIDYSFVTGEAVPLEKKSGDKIYAGGKQVGNAVIVEAINTVSQSYLTQLWSNDIFQKKVSQKIQTITDKASRIFTPTLLTIALIGFFVWSFTSLNFAFNVLTAVLIVACPCALALTAPYTWGNVIRLMGKRKLYLKNTTVIEQLSKVDTIVFDKTGTLTSNSNQHIQFIGEHLSTNDVMAIKNIVRGSNHPLSRRLYMILPDTPIEKPENYKEAPGKGIEGTFRKDTIKIGSASWVGAADVLDINQTKVYISINDKIKGFYVFENEYRVGLEALFQSLQNKNYQLFVLSGDNDGEQRMLERLMPKSTQLVFNQKPDDKLRFIKKLQENNHNVLMIGDGLNDAGALAQSNIGISISENVNVFTPASDAILDAESFTKLPYFLQFAKNAMKTIKMSYALALTYNTVGLSFALSNNLSPLVAAIIMPVSTATIISFVTIMSNYFARKGEG
ncbi:heavy metal translocating P-type ATPase metal-binding domain-containing protein [Paenimyroides aestuarii]|uniref:Heavy metal translocating P-type ATPase metal-binding domain-containing protein n=1 Tax=Paenimyroides aestuarii TaxID=2968490 RepID=A0ABY5NPX2_9FLAO|nr:heavy metal translocating P-type ATPase metal-binding domain-containing protein [Paenimyroides aestuarii]UUV20603.1 heavy metal translocating P-type ATPase metal-binding domain-containing protein [Paenimyroides aestuarii]